MGTSSSQLYRCRASSLTPLATHSKTSSHLSYVRTRAPLRLPPTGNPTPHPFPPGKPHGKPLRLCLMTLGTDSFLLRTCLSRHRRLWATNTTCLTFARVALPHLSKHPRRTTNQPEATRIAPCNCATGVCANSCGGRLREQHSTFCAASAL